MITHRASARRCTLSGIGNSVQLQTGVNRVKLDVTALRMRQDLEVAMRQSGPRLLSVARRYLLCEAECADAVQDAFVSALKNLPQFQGSSQVETWLYRILVNVCLMRIRAKRRRVTVSLDTVLTLAQDQSTHMPLCQAESRKIVQDAVNRLPKRQKEIIQLRYFEGLTTAETAQLLGVNASVLKTRLHRSCRALRHMLEERIENDL